MGSASAGDTSVPVNSAVQAADAAASKSETLFTVSNCTQWLCKRPLREARYNTRVGAAQQFFRAANGVSGHLRPR